jgi:hypothetical protein
MLFHQQARSVSTNGAVAEQESDDDTVSMSTWAGCNGSGGVVKRLSNMPSGLPMSSMLLAVQGVSSSSSNSSSNKLSAEDADDEEPGTHLGGDDDEGYIAGAMRRSVAQQHGPWNSVWLRTFSTDSSRYQGPGGGRAAGAGASAGGGTGGSNSGGSPARKGLTHWGKRRKSDDDLTPQQQQRTSLFPKVTPGEAPAAGQKGPGDGGAAGTSRQGAGRGEGSRSGTTGGGGAGGSRGTSREGGVGWARSQGSSTSAGTSGSRDARLGGAPPAPITSERPRAADADVTPAGAGPAGTALTTAAGGVGLGDSDDTLELRVHLREAFLR